MNIIKKVLLLIFSILITVAFLFVIVSGTRKQNVASCKGVKIHIDYSDGNHWLNTAEILRQIQWIQGGNPVGLARNSVKVSRIEEELQKNPYIADAEVFLNNGQVLQVEIVQKKALFRVLTTSGVGYYVSENQENIPLCPNFTPHVPLVLGNVLPDQQYGQKGEAKKALFTLMKAIVADSVMNALTDQVWVDDKNQFQLIPRIGNHRILLGDAGDLDEKFRKLKVFYRKAMMQTGWSYYETLDVHYDNQVVAVKRDTI